MKKLILIRHAKAIQGDNSLPDMKRSLSTRGQQNTHLMASRIAEMALHPDALFSSPAERALSTARGLANALDIKKKKILVDPALYTFNADDLLVWLKELDNDLTDIALVGHNPALTDLVNFLALTNLENLPTCGIAVLDLSIKRWSKVVSGCAELTCLNYPKKATSIEEARADIL